jgi:prepilin-type N-terminal cleavage/methylation domain-containing protein
LVFFAIRPRANRAGGLLVVSGVAAISDDQRGFTLIECVIACVVLATALLSIGHLSSTAMTRIADARNRTLATALAVAKLEELRTGAAPAAGADVVDSTGQPMQQGSVAGFERRWSAAPITPDAQILSVVVTPIPADAGREVRIAGGWMVSR